jgi:hypothetical protein
MREAAKWNHTFSRREKEGPAPKAWEDEGLGTVQDVAATSALYSAPSLTPHPPGFAGPLPLPSGEVFQGCPRP